MELITKKEVIQMLGISYDTLARMMRNKKIPFYKMGDERSSRVRFDKKDVIDYIEKSKV